MLPPAAGAAVVPSANDTVQRRSFTVPARARLARRPDPPPASSGSSDDIETLFTCPSTKIVSFTAPSPDPQGTIPCTTPTERTLAVGVLRIYRVVSSNVSFLNSGNLLHTIFPRSQCWCVDGNSKFALRIRQDSYYRIELPSETDEDKQRVQDFKNTLSRVLQYEKTRCPFTRGFDVELPGEPAAPLPRRKTMKPQGKAKKWLFDKTWMPEDGPRPSTPILEGSDSGTHSSYEEDDRSSTTTDANDASQESPASSPQSVSRKPAPFPSVSERAMKFQGQRSVTAPVRQSMSVLHSASSVITEIPEPEAPRSENLSPAKDKVDTVSMASSAESFETASQRSPSPETPQFLDAQSELSNPWESELNLLKEQDAERGRLRHRRQISDITVRPHSERRPVESPPRTPTLPSEAQSGTGPDINIHLASAPSTPPLISDSEDSLEFEPTLDVPTPPDTIRMRRLTGASQRRAFSPMPNSQNLIKPPNYSPTNPLTAALVRKTCELILGPPTHLVALMLKIAARVSKGAFGFGTYRVRHKHERIPCSWESSGDEWEEEDDFGIPLHNLEGSGLRKRSVAGEVD